MLAALLLIAFTPAAARSGIAQGTDTPAPVEEVRCPYLFDRNRMSWLHASQVPRYVYYRVLEPGDGTRRSSMMARIALEEEAIREATFEVVTRIDDGTSKLRVVLTRTIATERAGLDLSDPARVALTAERGKDEEPLRVALVAGERTERGGWLYETTTFEPDLAGAVALVDADEFEVSGPGQGWKPIFDEKDRWALRFFLWHHAPGGRAALELSEQRRASEAAAGETGADPARGAGTDGGAERDG